MVSSLKKWLFTHNWVLIFITLYFLLSVIKIEHPGVNNDQLMFVNTATFNPDNMFLWKSWRGIPMMIFPYIGALKSYFYMPIFYFFGVNIWSIRLPHVIFISISWFLLYKTLIIAFNKKIALLTLLLLCLDSSIIAYSKIDQGPTVLEFFFKILSVYLLYLYLSTKKIIFFVSVFPILVLGIFNKLNFIWFINAFVISFSLFYFKNFYNHFKSFGRFIPFLILIIPYLFLIKLFSKLSREVLLSYKSFSGVSLDNIYTNYISLSKNLNDILNGNMPFNIIYGENPTIFGNLISGLFIVILLGGLVMMIKYRIYNKSLYFLLSITILIFLQLLVTKNAVAAWHTLSVYPFLTVILSVMILQIYNVIKQQNFKKIFIFLICLILTYQLLVNLIYINSYSKPTAKVAYSGTIYELIDFVKISDKKIICLDVDICNQLLSFTQQTNKYKEPFFYLDPSTYTYTFTKLLENFNDEEKFLYVGHSEINSHFLGFRQSFFKYLNDNRIKYIKVKEFKDGDILTFEIYKIGYF